MNEADFRRSYQERFLREGRGRLWRIPDAPPFPEQNRDRFLHRLDLIGGRGRHQNLLHIVGARHAPLHGRDRHEDRIVLILAHGRLPF